MQNDDDKQADAEERTSAPEPDKLTTAQPEPEEAEEVAASGEPEAEEPEAGEAEAGEAEPEATAEGEDEAVTERADETGPEAGEEDAIAADLAKARAEAESYLDDLRRLQADFDNYRKRTLREQTARTASASQALVARLLPVLDNFELAVSAAEQSRDFDRMLKGVEMVLGALREVLEGEGLVKI